MGTQDRPGCSASVQFSSQHKSPRSGHPPRSRDGSASRDSTSLRTQATSKSPTFTGCSIWGELECSGTALMPPQATS